MRELFIKEVINGKLIEIEQANIFTTLQCSIELGKFQQTENRTMSDAERMLRMICYFLKIDGERISFEELSKSTDFKIFEFITESFNSMTNSNFKSY